MVNTELRTRKAALGGAPKTLDESTRSVEAICATEAPVVEFDYERYEYVRQDSNIWQIPRQILQITTSAAHEAAQSTPMEA